MTSTFHTGTVGNQNPLNWNETCKGTYGMLATLNDDPPLNETLELTVTMPTEALSEDVGRNETSLMAYGPALGDSPQRSESLVITNS